MKNFFSRFIMIFMISILILFIELLRSTPAAAQIQGNSGNELVLQIKPGLDNPRNSEGDFIELKDGRILYVYSRFIGDSGSDHAPAKLVARYSADGGISWTMDDEVIVDKEGDMNVMSVSLLRLQNNKIALVYLRKNSQNGRFAVGLE